MSAPTAPGPLRERRADAGSGRPRSRRGGPRGGALAGRDPSWARPALVVLLLGTAVLYLWDLSISGNANSFYAAATQAGSESWKAWFFGSLDTGNSITVDKPPASLWVSGLSARIFGYSSWSLLVPQALEGVASVAVLHAAVKRWSGPAAGLLAGAVLALTPAAALIFRFNNPDALLVLLMVVGAYCVVRALEAAGTRWLVLAGVALGFAFLTKMLQGFLVLPAFAGVYLLVAPTTFWRRVRQLLLAGVAIVVSAGWWIAAVAVWPASSRPYIGGSTDNSALELALGYNGIGRILGGSGNGGGGGVTGGTTGSSFGGAAGLARLFSSEFGNEISWLLPTALVALALGLWARRLAPRTDLVRASLLLWGGWVFVTGLVFAYMTGTIHPYYTVALAPGIAALVAIGGRELWRERASWFGRGGLALLVVTSAAWGFVLLGRTSSWHPELRWVVLVVALVAAVALLVPPRAARRLALVGVVAGVLSGLGGTGAFALATAGSAHTGSIPSVGPASAATGGFGGMGGTGGGFAGRTGESGAQADGRSAGQTGGGTPPTGAPGSTGTGSTGTGSTGTGGSSTARGGGGMGGGASTNSALTALLEKASSYRWAAAAIGSETAAGYELASDASVMPIGGFSGSDPAPTLAQFKAYVAAGDIHYFIAGGGMGGGRGGSSGVASSITSWVEAHYTATTVGGTTVYDLTQTAS